jgi:ABC-type Fe3+-siderophore transport system permease subunit
VPRWKQQLGGLLIAVVGGGVTAWTWYTALAEGHFSRKASMLFPAFFVLGLGVIIFPGYKDERTARGEDISGRQGLHLLTARWRAILVVALVAAAVNYALLSSL